MKELIISRGTFCYINRFEKILGVYFGGVTVFDCSIRVRSIDGNNHAQIAFNASHGELTSHFYMLLPETMVNSEQYIIRRITETESVIIYLVSFDQATGRYRITLSEEHEQVSMVGTGPNDRWPEEYPAGPQIVYYEI